MDSTRSTQIDEFLKVSGWGKAVRRDLAGDASFRRYERVSDGERHAVLMDAPPEKEKVKPFVQIAELLANAGFSAPRILARDEKHGFLLLEDLGDDSFTLVLAGRTPHGGRFTETPLYESAVDALIELHHQSTAEKIDLKRIAPYDHARLMQEAELLSEWYLPEVAMVQDVLGLQREYTALWQGLLELLPPLPHVLVLRDYHADNLMWLPARKGIARAGLLDFQDAVVGQGIYDLVSLLEDARRDVTPDVVKAMLGRYIKGTGLDNDQARLAYALLGAQRNCKIVGIFTRLCVRDGKAHYLKFLPRVWGHLMNDVSHPELAPLAKWIDRHVRPEFRGEITPRNAMAAQA